MNKRQCCALSWFLKTEVAKQVTAAAEGKMIEVNFTDTVCKSYVVNE